MNLCLRYRIKVSKMVQSTRRKKVWSRSLNKLSLLKIKDDPVIHEESNEHMDLFYVDKNI